MSNATIELVNSTDPADFLNKAKKVLPNRPLPSTEALEQDEKYSAVFMDQIREEAVLELIKSLKKENLIKLKEFDESLKSARALTEQIAQYQSLAHIARPCYEDIVIEEKDCLRFQLSDQIPNGEAFITSLEFIANVTGTLAEQASRIYEDGQYYPTQLTDISAYVRPATLIRPIEFDRYPSIDLDTVINNNLVGLYDALWSDSDKSALMCTLKIADQCAPFNVTPEDWREIDLFMASSETGLVLEQLVNQLEQYQKRALDYLKASEQALQGIHNQGDLANLARILLGLDRNNELMRKAMTSAATLFNSYLETLALSITAIEQVTRG